MRKFFYRLLLVIIVMACGMPFIMKDQYGDPLMTLADIKMPGLSIPGKGLNNDGENAATAKRDAIAVYRWQDDQGAWHFSDSENPDGNSETIKISYSAGISRTGDASLSGNVPPPQQSRSNVEDLLESGAIPLLHAGEIMQQARDVEMLLQQRYQQQEQASLR